MRGENNLGKDLAAIDAFYKKHPEMNTPTPTNTPTSKCEACEKDGEILPGSVHMVGALNCRLKPSTPTTDSKNSRGKCDEGNCCREKGHAGFHWGEHDARNTTDTGWESQKEQIGGRIHEVLNNTLSRKLTAEEYKRVVKDIGALAKTYESAAAKEEYERGWRAGFDHANDLD